VTRRSASVDDEGGVEPIAKGLFRAWLAAKLLPIAVRLAAWGAWLGAILAYGAFVVWKVRRLTKKGALDAPEPGSPPTPVSAKDRGVRAWIRGDEPLALRSDVTDGATPTP
jgi:hypothetical protein